MKDFQCISCQGTGHMRDGEICPHCDGHGKISDHAFFDGLLNGLLLVSLLWALIYITTNFF